MPDKIKIKVNKRSVTGRKVKKLRRDGILPANIYGKDIKSLAVKLSVKDFQKVFDKSGETSIIELSVDKETKTRPVLVHNIHRHPVSGDFLHADFYQVDLTKKVAVDIPIELSGEAPAVSKGGVLIQLLDEVKVEALPTDLPDKFTIDISKLEKIGEGISLQTIKVDPKKVKLVTDNIDDLIVKIEEQAKEEEEKPVEAETEVVEGEEEVQEGDETKEGDEKPKEGTKPKQDEKPEQDQKSQKKEVKPKEEKKEKN